MELEKLSPVGRDLMRHVEFDDEEKVYLEVRKHPVGLVLIYLGGLIASLVIFGILVIGAAAFDFSSVSTNGSSADSMRALVIGIGFFMTVFTVVITAVAAYVYSRNVLIVTSDKIVQQLYFSLFNKQISQLSIADVQDSTVKQPGILSHIFNFGTVTIETAGEQRNYNFTYAPSPYDVSKALTTAHEADVSEHGN